MISSFSLGVSAGEGRKAVSPKSSETRLEGRRSCGAAMGQAMAWPGIYNRMKAGGREAVGQGFKHVKDKVGFTGIGFPRESAFLTRNDKVR